MFGDMAKKAQEMQAAIQEVEVEGSSGGGLVKVSLGGRYECRSVWIEDALLKESKEVVQELLAAAFNSALTALTEAMNQKMREVMGSAAGMKLPAGFKMPF